jgi:hypothetical protein
MKYKKKCDKPISLRVTEDMEVGLKAEAARTNKSEAEVLQLFMFNLYKQNLDAFRLMEQHVKENENNVDSVIRELD